MKLGYLLPVAGLLAVWGGPACSFSAAETTPQSAPPRMLMITQSAGFRHRPVNRAEQEYSLAETAMQQLAAESGEFRVDCSQDVRRDVTRKNLENYEIVCFYTTGDLPIEPDELDYFLGAWIRAKGHGFIGVHSATDTFKTYRPYWDAIGGTFNGHPWGANSKVAITVHSPDHPAMKPFGESFEFRDEIYQFRNWQPQKVHVLMSLNMEQTATKRPYHVPVAWAKEIGEGKLFYNSLGHREETWSDPRFLQSLTGAIRWIAGREAYAVPPNPEVSAAQEKLAEQAAATVGMTLESIAAQEAARIANNRARQEAKAAAAAATPAAAQP